MVSVVEYVKRRHIFLILSFIVLIFFAILWYVKLYNNIMWEDEGNTYRAINVLLYDGFPIRKGPVSSSVYYDPAFNYPLYWQYTLEIILRIPLQVISIVMKNPTAQTFTPLLITVIIMAVVLYRAVQEKQSEEIEYIIIFGNVFLALSGFLMSSYHYIRYYWFVIASTYICSMIVGIRSNREHTVKDTFITIIISVIPFAFHTIGGVLIAVACLEELKYWIKNAFIKRRDTNNRGSQKKLIKVVLLTTVAVIIVIYLGLTTKDVLKLNKVDLDFALSFEGPIMFAKKIFFLDDMRNISLALISGAAIVSLLLSKNSDPQVQIGRVCYEYLGIMLIFNYVFGNILGMPRYNICCWTVLVLLLACFTTDMYIVLKSKRVRMISVLAVAVISLCLLPWFRYNPEWNLVKASRSDMKYISDMVDEFGDKVIVVSNGIEVLEYNENIKTLYRFRSEKKLDYYYINNQGIYNESGYTPFFGSISSTKAFLNVIEDDSVICFIGVKRKAIDEELVPFFENLGVFGNASSIKKEEFEKEFFDYIGNL